MASKFLLLRDALKKDYMTILQLKNYCYINSDEKMLALMLDLVENYATNTISINESNQNMEMLLTYIQWMNYNDINKQIIVDGVQRITEKIDDLNEQSYTKGITTKRRLEFKKMIIEMLIINNHEYEIRKGTTGEHEYINYDKIIDFVEPVDHTDQACVAIDDRGTKYRDDAFYLEFDNWDYILYMHIADVEATSSEYSAVKTVNKSIKHNAKSKVLTYRFVFSPSGNLKEYSIYNSYIKCKHFIDNKYYREILSKEKIDNELYPMFSNVRIIAHLMGRVIYNLDIKDPNPISVFSDYVNKFVAHIFAEHNWLLIYKNQGDYSLEYDKDNITTYLTSPIRNINAATNAELVRKYLIHEYFTEDDYNYFMKIINRRPTVKKLTKNKLTK